MRAIDFYFDPISPFVWLATTQIPAIEKKHGVRFRFIPALFAGLLEASGQKGPAETASKRIYTFRDALRWAGQYGKKMQGPPAHPFNPLAGLRLSAAIEEDTARARFATALCAAAWEEGRDITSPEVLRELLQGCGIEAATVLSRAETSEGKARLRANTDAAIARGVFGIPTFAVDNELFWGNDRLLLLESYLAGRVKIDESHLTAMLSRPRAADRKAVTVPPR